MYPRGIFFPVFSKFYIHSLFFAPFSWFDSFTGSAFGRGCMVDVDSTQAAVLIASKHWNSTAQFEP
jgi:hypothetical protein